MNTTIDTAVQNALANQSWFMRRKDTITAAAGTLLQLLNIAVAYTADGPEWASIVIALLIGLCQVVIHAGTPGAITPSMSKRLEAEAPDEEEETPEEVGSGVADGAEAHELAGYSTPNADDLDQDWGDAHESGSTVYGGEHRADQPSA